MSQVTIYVRESALEAAKAAAARAKISVSQWFAQYAEAEEQKPQQNWDEFFSTIDKNKDVWQDFPSQEAIRSQDLADRPLEAW